MEHEKTLVFQVKYGGLGDHLFFSHIPRIAKETGAYARVYLSSQSPFRHHDYRRLVWELNPHLDGFADETGVTVEGPSDGPDRNMLDAIMLALGIDDGKRFHEPELYYRPKNTHPELAGRNVYDPNYISMTANFDSIDLARTVREHSFAIDAQMQLRNKSVPLPVATTVASKDLEDFCDILTACERLYCLPSGTATLAAALGKPATVFHDPIIARRFLHSRLHAYIPIQSRKRFYQASARGLLRMLRMLRTLLGTAR